MGWKHRTLSVDPEARTGVCQACGPTEMVWRPRSDGGRWACTGGRKEQRHREAKTRPDRLDYCESCRIKPSPRAAVILKLGHRITLCANCRVLLKAEPVLFLASLQPGVRARYEAALRSSGPRRSTTT